MRITASLRARLYEVRAPEGGPALGVDVLMLSDSVWLMVGERKGPLESTAPAFVERTANAGRSWSTVLLLPHGRLWWVGRDGAEVVAAGGLLSGRGTVGEEQEDERPLLLRSRDGGESFARIYPRVAGGIASWRQMSQFAFSGRGSAIAVPRRAFQGSPGEGVLRSGDDGHSWRWVHLPNGGTADYGAAWTPDGRVAYVTGVTGGSRRRRCEDGLWRSTDAGASWQLQRGACQDPAYGVAFTDSVHGFLSSGPYPKLESGQVVYATDDGGSHWQTSWRVRGPDAGSPLVALQFPNPSHGWALPGYQSLGANGYDAGDAMVSTDGGRQWRDTGQPAGALSALPDGSALAVLHLETEIGETQLALTRDWGASWAELTPPADLLTEALLGGSSLISEVTDAGSFQSSDGGRTWRPFDPRQLVVSRTLLAATPAITATLDTSDDRCALLLSRDHGASWRTVAEPGGTLQPVRVPTGGAVGCATQAMAFANGQDGIASSYRGRGGCRGPGPQAVYLTGDGGVRWRPLCLPELEGEPSSVAASGETYAVLEGSVSSEQARIAISLDGGRTWTVQALPAGRSCSSVSAYVREIWITCAGERRNFVYHSTDGGASWQAYLGGPGDYEGSKRGAFQPGEIVALGPGEAIASAAGYYEGPGDGSLWRTTDGGASWTQEWPRRPVGPSSRPIIR
jgi:photosystem II stability/assembly factor-like uncharacterized protein